MSSNPPSYEEAVTSGLGTGSGPRLGDHEQPEAGGRGVADDDWPLPEGWVGLYDSAHSKKSYLDTKATPQRPIGHHPYVDELYLATLNPKERERVEELKRQPRTSGPFVQTADGKDITSESVNLPEKGHVDAVGLDAQHPGDVAGSIMSHADPHVQGGGMMGFARMLKDKATRTIHEQREAERLRQHQRELQEQAVREEDRVFHECAVRAIKTGRTQLLGKDRDGVEVYLEPPSGNYRFVTETNRISEYYKEMFYARGGAPGPKGARYIRLDDSVSGDSVGKVGPSMFDRQGQGFYFQTPTPLFGLLFMSQGR